MAKKVRLGTEAGAQGMLRNYFFAFLKQNRKYTPSDLVPRISELNRVFRQTVEVSPTRTAMMIQPLFPPTGLGVTLGLCPTLGVFRTADIDLKIIGVSAIAFSESTMQFAAVRTTQNSDSGSTRSPVDFTVLGIRHYYRMVKLF
jgi:hypothetical protein